MSKDTEYKAVPLRKVPKRVRHDGNGRRSKGMPEVSLTKVAKEVGVSLGYLSRIVAGKKVPGMKVGEKVGKALGMRLEEVLRMARGDRGEGGV